MKYLIIFLLAAISLISNENKDEIPKKDSTELPIKGIGFVGLSAGPETWAGTPKANIWFNTNLLGIGENNGIYIGGGGSMWFLFALWYSLSFDVVYKFYNFQIINSLTFSERNYTNSTGGSGAVAGAKKVSYNLKFSLSLGGFAINIGPSWTLTSWLIDSKTHPDWEFESNHLSGWLEGSSGGWMNYEIGIVVPFQ